MNEQQETGANRIKRIATNVPGFDEVMAGGLLSGATHLVVGPSGTGKTVLTQQIAFNYAHLGHNVLCLTLLSESHEKMIANLAAFAFFDHDLIGSNIQYLSLFNEVEEGGLGAFNIACRRATIKYQAKLVIVDGVSSLREFASNKREFRKSLFDFNAQMSALGCTVLLLVDDELSPERAPEYAIADSITRLHNQTTEKRHVRYLEVIKSRATAALTGLHGFDITVEGIVVYPRIEAILHKQRLAPPPAPPSEKRRRFGITGLDEMVGGGLLAGDLLMLLGTPNTGKSLTGLRFIYEGARQGEKTMVVSLQYSEAMLRRNTEALGFGLGQYLDKDLVNFMWFLPLERHLEEVVGKVIQAIEEFKPTRLLIDSLSELETLSSYSDQLTNFWVALTNYLRNKEITTIATMEYKEIVGNTLVLPHRPISMLVDGVIFLRSVELKGELKQAVAVLEMKNSQYERGVHEYLVGTGDPNGLAVGQVFRNAENLLSGMAHSREK